MHHPCSFSKPVKIHIYVGLWGNIECGSENWGPKGYPHELPKNDEKGSKWPRSAGLDGQIVEPCPRHFSSPRHLCSAVSSPCNPKACHQCPISDVPDFCPHRTPIQEACNHRIDGKTETGHLYSMVKAMVSRSDFPNKTNPFYRLCPTLMFEYLPHDTGHLGRGFQPAVPFQEVRLRRKLHLKSRRDIAIPGTPSWLMIP